MKFTTSLKKNREFRVVYNKGKSIANRNLVMYILPNKLTHNRLGVSVSKKVGNSVIRSRATRLIRESCRLNENNLVIGFDVVVIARNSVVGLKCDEVNRSFMHLCRKHKIVK